MPLHHHVRALGDVEASFQREAPAFNLLQLFHEVERIHYDAIADDAALAVVQNSAWHEMQHVFAVADDDGMAGVGAALEAHHDIGFLG